MNNWEVRSFYTLRRIFTKTNMINIDVLILCGGQGRRLHKVISDRPKPMAEINGRPFLDILISYVSSFGLKRFILCTGYMVDYIDQYFSSKNDSIEFVFSKEETPLGTGGAVKNAERFIKTSPFFVMNGDSFCSVDLIRFLNFHKSKDALLSMVVTKAKSSGDFGSLVLDNSEKIVRFKEKVRKDRALINAGIYLFEKDVLFSIPRDVAYSLEHDFFPKLAGQKFYGYTTTARLIDIGTPERYEEAKRFFKK